MRKEVCCLDTVDWNVSTFFKNEINSSSNIKFYASKLSKRSINNTQMFYYDCSQIRSHFKCPCKIYVIFNYNTAKGDVYRSLESHNHS